MSRGRWWAGGAILTAAMAGGVFIWLRFQQPALPEGFASGNGRIEATAIEYDLVAVFEAHEPTRRGSTHHSGAQRGVVGPIARVSGD